MSIDTIGQYIARLPEHPAHWAGAARDAGAHLVATHIEQSSEQESALASGADLLQGYYFGRPEVSIPAARDEQRYPRETAVQ